MELKGLDSMSMINGEQKKDATMQLFIQAFASRVALVLQEVDQALKVLCPETYFSIENGCIAYWGKLFYITHG